MKKKTPIKMIEAETGLLYRFAILVIGDSAAAGEAVLGSCAAVYRRLTGREDAGQLRTLLLAELYRCCSQARADYQQSAVLTAFPAAAADGAELIASLAKLSPACRADSVLCYACGLSRQEIKLIAETDSKGFTGGKSC